MVIRRLSRQKVAYVPSHIYSNRYSSDAFTQLSYFRIYTINMFILGIGVENTL